MVRMRPEDFPDGSKAREQIEAALGDQPKKKPKYKNVRFKCPLTGKWYDSNFEWEVHQVLKEIFGVENIIPQPSMPIGEQRMRPDFLVTHPDGHVEFMDAKGAVTKDWKRKARVFKRLYGYEIRVIKRKDLIALRAKASAMTLPF